MTLDERIEAIEAMVESGELDAEQAKALIKAAQQLEAGLIAGVGIAATAVALFDRLAEQAVEDVKSAVSKKPAPSKKPAAKKRAAAKK